MAPAKRECEDAIYHIKVHDNCCLFHKHEQKKHSDDCPLETALLSTSFVTLVETHNVDVPGPSNGDVTVLSPTACILCSGPCDQGRL